MNEGPQIRLLEPDRNKRGDLFNRVVKDLFHTLGYDPIRVNVPKTGREVDLLGAHRFEHKRYFRGECKATKVTVGGDEINKFIGALDAERKQLQQAEGPECSVSGYFVSLSGFTESAIEQEATFGTPRLTLLTGPQVVDELVRGRVIVPAQYAIDAASHVSMPRIPLKFHSVELLAHGLGLMWVVYYHDQRKITHFALIHADGDALSPLLAAQVVKSAKKVGVRLDALEYLPPRPSIGGNVLKGAQAAYFKYLTAACGEIQLDGLPADEQLGAKRLKLESLFVPLNLIPLSQGTPGSVAGGASTTFEAVVTPFTRPKSKSQGRLRNADPARRRDAEGHARSVPLPRKPLGQVLARVNRLALLATPGAGKSTLLKRIAVAYASVKRRGESKDMLPERDWVPLFVRCRDLGALVRAPILQVLMGIADRAEMDPQTKTAFGGLVHNTLRDGKALLLIDGLDEITDDGDRVAFVSNLRTFLGTYPTAALIITSREAGFRAVAGGMAAECEKFRLADFDDQDIRLLVSAWHREVYGDSPGGREAAQALATAILENDRIRQLATNPLLLTTLLLVKRWVGQLPTKRTVLYEKAIEVLLMTWNVQAHAPIGLDEAIPRLEYIAYTMMTAGLQGISRTNLARLLAKARQDLPEALGYSVLKDIEFIDRIELRSSLLVQAGHTLEAGRLVPLYEFRHLTFQEYLVARAITDGNYPGRQPTDTPATVLKPYIDVAAWLQVVPMAAVLAGREAKAIVAELIEGRQANLVVQCLMDELQLAPIDVDQALMVVARSDYALGGLFSPHSRNVRGIASGKFGVRFFDLIRQACKNPGADAPTLGATLATITVQRLGWSESDMAKGKISIGTVQPLLVSGDPIDQATGALIVMEAAYAYKEPIATDCSAVGALIVPLLKSESEFVQFAAAWAIVWLSKYGWTPPDLAAMLTQLSALWRDGAAAHLRRQGVWATCRLPIVPRDSVRFPIPDEEITSQISTGLDEGDSPNWPFPTRAAALILAYYYGAPLIESELVKRVAHEAVEVREQQTRIDAWAEGILRNLGPEGIGALNSLHKEGLLRES